MKQIQSYIMCQLKHGWWGFDTMSNIIKLHMGQPYLTERYHTPLVIRFPSMHTRSSFYWYGLGIKKKSKSGGAVHIHVANVRSGVCNKVHSDDDERGSFTAENTTDAAFREWRMNSA